MSVSATPGPPTTRQTLVPFEILRAPLAYNMLMAPSPEELPKVRVLILPTFVETLAYFAPLITASAVDPGTPLGVQFVALDQDPLVFRVDVPAHAEPVTKRKTARRRMNCFISEIKPTFSISQGLVPFI